MKKNDMTLLPTQYFNRKQFQVFIDTEKDVNNKIPHQRNP